MTTGLIRPAQPTDIPDVAALRRLSFQHSAHATRDLLEKYLHDVFFESPWSDPAFPSWVFDDGTGRVLGFLGSLTRPLRHRGQPLTMAVLSHFMVHPESRGQGVGRRMMDHFLSGPQDVIWSDVANEPTRAVWKAVGGREARLHSLYWRRPLRPLRDATGRMVAGTIGRVAMRLARPAIAAVDAGIVRYSAGFCDLPDPPGQMAPLDLSAIARLTAEFLPPEAVQPAYTAESLTWLMRQIERRPGFGALDGAMVADAHGVIGWFIWLANPGGMSRVVQFAAKAGSAEIVFGHLLRAAWRRRVVTLEGRMEPLFFDAFSQLGASFRRESPWVLVHSRHSYLLAAIQGGDSFLTRLDGEWWMGG
jgi:GNAT superfamily N-acetyltransferase